MQAVFRLLMAGTGVKVGTDSWTCSKPVPAGVLLTMDPTSNKEIECEAAYVCIANMAVSNEFLIAEELPRSCGDAWTGRKGLHSWGGCLILGVCLKLYGLCPQPKHKSLLAGQGKGCQGNALSRHAIDAHNLRDSENELNVPLPCTNYCKWRTFKLGIVMPFFRTAFLVT